MTDMTPPLPLAVSDWISDRSVALLLAPEEESLYIGSAAAIELCGRPFLATAGHNLDGIATRDQLRALPGGKRLERPLYILEWNVVQRTAAGNVDVAWLEVETVSAATSPASFITVDRLLCGATHQDDTVFVVHGYPEALIDREDVYEGVPLLSGTSVFSFSVPPGPTPPNARGDSDLLLEWPPSDLREVDVEVPHPSGVSGGGVWLFPRHTENPRWAYADLRLVALNRSWRRSSRQLTATRIEHWLAALAQDKPFTRREIEPLLERIQT